MRITPNILSIILVLFTVSAHAQPVMVDVFVNVDDSINHTINEINNSFETAGIYQKYNVTPLIKNHKVHLTMYLTEYEESKIPLIKQRVLDIAKTTQPLQIQDYGVSLKASNFLMLEIKNTIPLQILSDKITASLMELRNNNAIIPTWVRSDLIKTNMFTQFGSPNVYEGFDPHFSIFAAKIPQEQQAMFSQQVNQHLTQIKFQPHNYQITEIGIAVTDNDGQITKLIASCPLTQTSKK